jgi:hypothetical protein
MGTARKPHNDNPGYVTERRHPAGGHLAIYVAEHQNIAAEHKYVLVLEMPNEMRFVGPSFPSLPKARVFYKSEIANPQHDWS